MNISDRINSKMSATDYAGKYLREYESARYSFLARAVLPFENIYNIIVPADAEEFGDLSFYQEDTNWDVYRTHARAAILRIGQGSWEDIKFERNYSEGKRVGCLLGGYYFYDGRTSPQQQAGVVIAAMWNKTFELELYVDWERNYGGAHEGLQNVVAFMQLLDAAGLKVKAIGMYTGYFFFLENSNAVKNASQYNYLKNKPLWLAWYAAASLVKIPAAWTDYTLWQWGTPVLDWGQKTKEIDMNMSRYSKLEFEKHYINGTTTPPTEPPVEPPTNGGTMPTYTVKPKSDNTKIFKNYDGSGGNIDDNFDMNETAKGDSINYNGYMHLYKMNGENMNGYIHTSKINYTVDAVTPPPVDPPVEPPPAGTTLPATVESTDVWKDDAGNVLATYKGTLTKQ